MSSWASAASAEPTIVIGGHDGEDDQRGRGGGEDGEEPGDEVDTGGDHRRGVDQRGDGRGARHRVGEPGVQRELRRLARHAGEQQQGDQGGVVEAAGARRSPRISRDAERAGVGGEREQADQEGDVAELGDQERLEGGGAGLRGLPVVADQEVRADAHDLPADQQHHQVAGVDDEQHRGGEEGDERGVRGVARVVAQIAGRVDLHAGGDDADQDGDEGGEAVDVQGEVDRDRAGGGRARWRRRSAWPPPWRTATTTARTSGRRAVGRTASGRTKPGARAAEEQAGRGAEERQEGDEDGEGRRGHAVASAFSAGPGRGRPCRASSSGASASSAAARRCRGACRCPRCPGCGRRAGRSPGRCRSRRRRWRW